MPRPVDKLEKMDEFVEVTPYKEAVDENGHTVYVLDTKHKAMYGIDYIEKHLGEQQKLKVHMAKPTFTAGLIEGVDREIAKLNRMKDML